MKSLRLLVLLMAVILDHTGRPFDSGPDGGQRYFACQPGSVPARQTISFRGFEAAKTDRLNESQWSGTGRTVNEDLQLGLFEIRDRCLYEMENNGFVEGVIKTHVTDVVGENGPTLQVESDNEVWNRRLQSAWNNWAEVASVDGDSLVDLLQMDVRLLWWAGEFLDQIVEFFEYEAVDGVTMRLHEVHPRRLSDPINRPETNVINGVEVDHLGRAVAYHVESFLVDQGLQFGPARSERIERRHAIHFFQKVEPGQVRGYPMLAPVIQPIRDIRDYDAEVLDAARAAANFGVILATNHPDAPFLETNECVDMERRTMRTAPPGWQPHLMKAEQPTTSYVDFRTERQREIGRPANMPAMIVRLDSSNHNFSSARFDGQRYDRGNRALQKTITRRKLMRLLKIVERQAGLQTSRPEKATVKFIWPASPHVDPTKEAKAAEILLSLGIIDEFTLAAMHGLEYEAVCELRAKAAKCREEHGLSSAADQGDDQQEGGENAESSNNPQARAALRRLVEQTVEEMLEDQEPFTVSHPLSA